MSQIALSDLLGAAVYDPAGLRSGRVREVALCPQEDRSRVSALIVRTKSGDRLLTCPALSSVNGGIHASTPIEQCAPCSSHEGLLLLERDLLDQQIIDVNGRKVVRVNDVEMYEEKINSHIVLKVSAVDIGARGAIRRLLKGVAPSAAVRVLLKKIPPRMIPWDFVDLIETDPARRVKLKISNERLAKLHPADLADIIEDLAPDEREAVFETLDEEVAAEALEEIQPKLQRSIVESLDSERAADIVEEMDPDAAADLLADLPRETSEEIIEKLEPQERQDMTELLEHHENTAAGRMTTEYLSVPWTAKVTDAIEALRNFEGGVETVNTIFLVDESGKLAGAVPLAKLVLAKSDDPMMSLVTDLLLFVQENAKDDQVVELFDKYNLMALPVVDEAGHLTGIITSDDIVTLLRSHY
jgi:magnesium transporter